jgi:hypothetical protein
VPLGTGPNKYVRLQLTNEAELVDYCALSDDAARLAHTAMLYSVLSPSTASPVATIRYNLDKPYYRTIKEECVGAVEAVLASGFGGGVPAICYTLAAPTSTSIAW